MNPISKLFNESNLDAFTKLFNYSKFQEYLDMKDINYSQKKHYIKLSIKHFIAKSDSLSPESITFLSEYEDFIDKHFVEICILLTPVKLKKVAINKIIFRNTSLVIKEQDNTIEKRAPIIRSKLIKFYKDKTYVFNVLDLFLSFTGIDDSYYIKKIVPFEHYGEQVARSLILDSITGAAFKKIKVIHYMKFWERYLSYLDDYKQDLLRDNEISILQKEKDMGDTKTSHTTEPHSNNYNLIEGFKPRYSGKITPEVLYKCIEIREKGNNVATQIWKEVATYYSFEKGVNLDPTTIRHWINDNKKCVLMFANKNASQIMLMIRKKDITEWFTILQEYNDKFTIMVNKIEK
jgi:hypothetical protein